MPAVFRSLRRVLLVLVAVGLATYAIAYVRGRPSYEYSPGGSLPGTFEEFLAKRHQESRERQTRPNNEERLLRVAGARKDVAFLFIHGFGASRAEGEAVVDPLALEFKANTYYMRLPGHGTNTLDHAKTTFPEYLRAAEDALFMTTTLGRRVVVFGSSTGALIATYLAAKHPDRVRALVLAAPLYRFGDPLANVIPALPGGVRLIQAVYGENRFAGWSEDPEKRKQDGYEDHWLVHQKYSAVGPLNDLRRFVARDSIFQKVTAPVLVFYYYKDEKHKDTVVDVEAIQSAFAQFGRSEKPHALNRLVPIADGNHILLSKYVRTDKARILSESRTFLSRVLEADAAAATTKP